MRGPHYESSIRFETDLVVVKTYRSDCQCVQWLNSHLARYYDPVEGQPVAQHEFAALKLLAPYGLAPRPLRLECGSIAMEYAGEPVSPSSDVSPEEYERQCRIILAAFEKLGFRHNDLLPGNVLVHHGKIKIIDYTLSEFGGVEIAKELPNPHWARMGQDQELLAYAPKTGWLKRLFHLGKGKSS